MDGIEIISSKFCESGNLEATIFTFWITALIFSIFMFYIILIVFPDNKFINKYKTYLVLITTIIVYIFGIVDEKNNHTEWYEYKVKVISKDVSTLDFTNTYDILKIENIDGENVYTVMKKIK